MYVPTPFHPPPCFFPHKAASSLTRLLADRRDNKILLGICCFNIVLFFFVKFYYVTRKKRREEAWHKLTGEEKIEYIHHTKDEGRRGWTFDSCIEPAWEDVEDEIECMGTKGPEGFDSRIDRMVGMGRCRGGARRSENLDYLSLIKVTNINAFVPTSSVDLRDRKIPR